MSLAPETTFGFVTAAARAGRFVSYGDVAFANGADWNRVRRGIGDHLRAVCGLALARGGPLVSSIVVNARHVRTGDMEEATRAGFLAAARSLGFAWDDGAAFLREQQAATFRWAEDRPPVPARARDEVSG